MNQRRTRTRASDYNATCSSFINRSTYDLCLNFIPINNRFDQINSNSHGHKLAQLIQREDYYNHKRIRGISSQLIFYGKVRNRKSYRNSFLKNHRLIQNWIYLVDKWVEVEWAAHSMALIKRVFRIKIALNVPCLMFEVALQTAIELTIEHNETIDR